MKYLLIAVLFVLHCAAFCQITESRELEQGYIGSQKWEIYQTIYEDTSGKYTNVYFTISFKNAEYEYIYDGGFIYLNDTIQLEEFVLNLEEIAKKPKGSQYSVYSGKVHFYRGKSVSRIGIYDKNEKYFYIKPKHALKFCNAIRKEYQLFEGDVILK